MCHDITTSEIVYTIGTNVVPKYVIYIDGWHRKLFLFFLKKKNNKKKQAVISVLLSRK